MRLSVLSEAAPLSKLISLLRRGGVDVSDPVIRKLFNFKGRSPAGGDGDEINQLFNDDRLVAWLDQLPGANGLEHIKKDVNSFYIFKPENRDIAQILSPKRSTVNDILNGLAFGYPHDRILDFASSRTIVTLAKQYLERIGFKYDIPFAFFDGGILWVNCSDMGEKDKIEKLGIKTFYATTPPIPEHQCGYYFGIEIPKNLRKSNPLS